MLSRNNPHGLLSVCATKYKPGCLFARHMAYCVQGVMPHLWALNYLIWLFLSQYVGLNILLHTNKAICLLDMSASELLEYKNKQQGFYMHVTVFFFLLLFICFCLFGWLVSLIVYFMIEIDQNCETISSSAIISATAVVCRTLEIVYEAKLDHVFSLGD